MINHLWTVHYFLQTNLIGMDALLKVLDPSQLTPDLDGALLYDHSVWIELRCVSKIYFWDFLDILKLILIELSISGLLFRVCEIVDVVKSIIQLQRPFL